MRESELKLEIGGIRGCIEVKVYSGIGSVLSKHTESGKYETFCKGICMYVLFLTFITGLH